jgi:hypothetical protein
MMTHDADALRNRGTPVKDARRQDASDAATNDRSAAISARTDEHRGVLE